MVANPNLLQLVPYQREYLEKLGEPFVRQAVSGNFWPNALDGNPNPQKTLAMIWLAEIDEEARKRAAAHEAEQDQLNKRTFKAVIATLVISISALGIAFLSWVDPQHTTLLWLRQYISAIVARY